MGPCILWRAQWHPAYILWTRIRRGTCDSLLIHKSESRRTREYRARSGNVQFRCSRSLWPAQRCSRFRRQHEHFAIIDLIFRKNIWAGFRIYLNFRVRQARLDCSDGLGLIGNSNEEYFLAHCTTCASARPAGADLPTFCHAPL